MKARLSKNLVIISVLYLCSCATNVEEGDPTKYVPDHTPFIAGLIEFSPDTTHHYPEIVVGYVSDVQTKSNQNFHARHPEIYNPTLLTQVTKTTFNFGLNFDPEPQAEVSIRGPIDKPGERIVEFVHEAEGVYGDQNYNLTRVPNGRYELKVELPDNITYTSTTHIPEAVEVSFPDSIGLQVEYDPYNDGTPREKDIESYSIIYGVPDNSFLTAIQPNSDKDRDLLLLEPSEKFRFLDKGPFLRTGAAYGVALLDTPQDTLERSWIQRLDKPKEEVWMQRKHWIRFSYFSAGIGGNFYSMIPQFATEENFSNKIQERRFDALSSNDSTYLFDVSTIRKIGSEGEALPKDSSDAIGFFSGYYSRYKRTTLYPIRNFDLDTVLTEN